jgi:uncharacterized metal-binding protein YceD (DUF177 family)
MKNKEYIIPFSGLKQGTHSFDFVLGEKFFQQFDFEEFISTQIQVSVQLNKMSTMMELAFAAQGSVRVPCDVTGELFDLPIQATLDLVVKFGEEFNDENESLLILPHMEHQVDVAQYLYEMVVLAVPQKRVHPGVLDGTLQNEAIELLEKFSVKEVREPKAGKEDNTDPRWDALKNLINDKKE